jgi:glycosyltransferase involved in cell wall biosynthesis
MYLPTCSMKLLYLAPDITLPGSHGGAAHVEGKLSSFSRLGYDIIYVTQKLPGQPFLSKHSYGTNVRLPVLPSFLKLFSYSFVLFFVVLYLLLKYDFNLVYERGRIFGGFGVLLASFFGKKTVYEMNEPYYDLPVLFRPTYFYYVLGWFCKLWHNLVVKRTTLVTVTHPSFVMYGAAPKEKTFLLTHGVDVHQFSKATSDWVKKKYHLQRKFVVLYTGSFASWHSCEQIIRTAHLFDRTNKHIVFLMVGEGKLSAICRALVKKLRLSNVIFTGPVPFGDIPSYIHASDVCVALFDRQYPPFKKYSFFYSPMKITEYMATGKPVIASNFGNLKLLIRNKKNGLLVNEQYVEDIAQAILTFVQRSSFCRTIGITNKRETIKKYDWDVINSSLLRRIGVME